MELLILILIIGGVYWLLKKNKNKSNNLQQPNSMRPSKRISSNTTVSKQAASTSNSRSTTQISSFNSDDDFASFTITVGRSEPKSNNIMPGRWIAENEPLTIQGRQINRGFYYYGGRLDMLAGFGTEPSLVDASLPANAPTDISENSVPYSDESLGYWPSYASLSSACRGIYLDWLASQRSNPNIPIGYVFIYFAGFERRVVENLNNDVVSNEEFILIFKEISRLNRIYNAQRSFNSYSANLLEYMTLIRPNLFENNSELLTLLPESANNSTLRFKYHLAKTVASKTPITASLAWQWLNYSGEYNFKTPAKRCSDEFEALFYILFNDTYPNGFTVPPNKTKLKIHYHSASRSIANKELDVHDLPDPSILKSPVKKLIAIAERCNDELDPYSRYLGREGNSKDDLSAIVLLPKKLIEHKSPALIEDFKNWANSIVKNKKGITTTRSLWANLRQPLPNSLSKKDNELLINLVDLAGFGVAPDQRYHQARIKSDGSVVLFQGGHGEDFTPSESFNQARLFLRLGAMVATIDGYVDDHEVNTLMTLIYQDSSLNDIEKKSLASYLTWRLNTPANMVGLKAKLAKLEDHQTASISRFIISVALANGNVEPSQIKQIEKLYTTLGLDKSSVSSDIHQLTTTTRVSLKSNNSQNTTQQNIETQNPIKDAKTSTADTNTFSINEDLLAHHENETADARTMLASIFASDDDDWEESDDDLNELQGTESTNTENTDLDNRSNTQSNKNNEDSDSDINRSKDSQIDGLDKPHSQLYRQLIQQEIWSLDEVEALCNSLNLMINGAIETINDWSFDRVDAPVIYNEDEIEVDLEIVAELQTENE